MNEIQRLLNLVPYITTHQGISMQELSSEFSISKKELLADLETLFLCGLPGYTPLELMEISFDDGFVTIRNADELQKPRNLTSSEAALLLIGLHNLKSVSPENDERIQSLIERVKSKVKVPLDIAPQSHLFSIRKIQGAINQRKKISFRYTSRYMDETKFREVSPQEIVGEGSQIYLKGYCHIANGYRTFDISRISGIDSLEESQDFPDIVSNIFEVEIKITKRYRRFLELFRSERFTTFSLLWPTRAVVASGGDVIALSPEELKKRVGERAKAALAQYEHLR